MTEQAKGGEFEMPKYLTEDVVVYDWCYYLGERYFGVLNFEEDESPNKHGG